MEPGDAVCLESAPIRRAASSDEPASKRGLVAYCALAPPSSSRAAQPSFSKHLGLARLGEAAAPLYAGAPPPASDPQDRGMTERTLSIIKPDATRRNLTGKINAVIEDAGLTIVAQRRIRLSRADAERFYDVHKERPFFADLVEFMTSGPVVVQVLEGDGAVARYREVMGATNPANAAPGTIRQLFAEGFTENSVHGSDSPENATIEIGQFFDDADIVG